MYPEAAIFDLPAMYLSLPPPSLLLPLPMSLLYTPSLPPPPYCCLTGRGTSDRTDPLQLLSSSSPHL